MNQKVSNKITHLYFAMSVLILNLHSAYMSLFDESVLVTEINQVIKILCNMSVPTFFFISALLFYRNCEKKRYIEVIIQKTKTLVIPYLCWNLICFPLKEFKNVLGGVAVSISNIWELLLKIITSGYDPVLWFVRVLFIYFLIYPILLSVVKRKKICLSVMVLVFVFNIYLGPTVGYSSIRYWIPIYLLGAYIGYWKKTEIFESKERSNLINICGALALLAILITFAYFSDLGMYVCRMISPLCYWEIGDLFLDNKKPYWIEKQSFFIYCTQMIFSIVAQKIWIFIFGRGEISAIIANVGIPVILLTIIGMSAFLLYKTVPNVYAFLTGGRVG